MSDRWNMYDKEGTQLHLHCIHRGHLNPEKMTPLNVYKMSNQTIHCTHDKNLCQTVTPTYIPGTWIEFVAMQPKRIRDVINNTTYSSITDVIARIQQDDHLIAVSDGSVREPLMSFGWIITNSKGATIAKGNGPTNGMPSSMRSEADGMLAATVFIGSLQSFTNQTFSSLSVTFIADNSALITRMKERLTYNNVYPNATLAPEYDLTEQIHRNILDFKIKQSFVWVKGHQDETFEESELSLEATLNVEADSLAERYYEERIQSVSTCLLHPACPCVLTIRGTTITSNYDRHITRAFLEPNYIQFLQQMTERLQMYPGIH